MLMYYIFSIKSKVLSQLYNFFSFIHVCISDSDVVLGNSANGPFEYLQNYLEKTCINVDGLEWLRPKWKGLSIYFRISSKLSTIDR